MDTIKKITLSAQHKNHSRSGCNRAIRHNITRHRIVDNQGNKSIDKTRTLDNRTFVNTPLDSFLNNVLGPSVELYNTGQKQKSRRTSVEKKVWGDKRNPKPIHEMILSFGNSLDVLKNKGLDISSPNIDTESEEWNIRVNALTDIANCIQEELQPFKIFNMVLHLDEGNPHLHVLFLPVTSSDAKFDKSLSFNKALFNICEYNDINISKNADGEYTAVDAFTKVFDKIIKNLMLDRYNKHSQKTTIRENKREARKALTNKEYKKITEPIIEKFRELEIQQSHLTMLIDRVDLLLDILDDEVKDSILQSIDELDDIKHDAKQFTTNISLHGYLEDSSIHHMLLDLDVTDTDLKI